MREFLCALAIVFAAGLNVVMFGSFVGTAIEYFKEQKYLRFGLALGMSLTNLFILFHIFAL